MTFFQLVKTNIECQSRYVVIFSLSLIGKNWQEYIVEAKRCLWTRDSFFIVVTTNELNERRRYITSECFKR